MIIIAITGEVAEKGEQTLSCICAVIRKEECPDEHITRDLTSADDINAFCDLLPESDFTICHGAKWASALDTMELSRIIFPSLADYNLDSILIAKACNKEAPEENKNLLSVCINTLELFSLLQKTAGNLPSAVLFEINGLLALEGEDSLKAFFSNAAQNKRATSEDSNTFRDLFVSERFSPPRREIPDPSEYEPLDPEDVSAHLSPTGEFAGILPGYESRDGQIEMAEKVSEAFNGSHHLLAEAGTGTGKSFAYLVPSIFWAVKNKTPVIVSTNTKNLQSQLFEKDIPIIRNTLGIDFKAALIKGRGNYLCLRKLSHLLNDAAFELLPEEKRRLLGVLIWAASTGVGDVSELTEWNELRAIGMGSKLTSTADDCAGRSCSFYRSCFLTKARAKSLAADLIVANHSLVFAEMNTRSQALPPYGHVVFDEAHNIEDSATRHFSVEISISRLRFILRRLGHLSDRKKGRGLLSSLIRQLKTGAFTGDEKAKEVVELRSHSVADAVQSTGGDVKSFFGALKDILKGDSKKETRRIDKKRRPIEGWDALVSEKAQLIKSLSGIGIQIDLLNEELRDIDPDGLGLQMEFVRDFDAINTGLKEFSGDVAFVLDASDEDYVFWVEPIDARRGGARAWGAPVHIGEKLADELYGQKLSVVFTSATLSAMGSFNFLKNRLGIDKIASERLMEFDAGTPFDYASQSVAMVPMFLPEPTDTDRNYIEEFGNLLARLFKRTNGRSMALFTSYSMLNKTLDILNNDLAGSNIRLLAQGHSGSRETITATFKEDIGSVLMGTHSFWEGVDLPGETLSCLVVARLPFAVFTDPLEQARGERVEAGGVNSFMGYSLPNAVIRFRQGFGRLIRHRSDKGVVIVADRRIISKRYGKWFRSSIPCRTFKFFEEDILLNEVEGFLI